jgi:hypothetical protein
MPPSKKKLLFHLTGHASRLCALKIEKVSGVRDRRKRGVLDMPGKHTHILSARVLVEGTIDEQHGNLDRRKGIYILALIEREASGQYET